MGRRIILLSVAIVAIISLAGCSDSGSSANSTNITVNIGTCRNPSIIENGNKWITDDRVPANNELELRGSFEKHRDDTATLRLEDGYTLEYRHEGEFPTEPCIIG